MVLQVCLCKINFGLFNMVAARKIVLAIFVLDDMSLIMVIHHLYPSDVMKEKKSLKISKICSFLLYFIL
jgi:hypothetical protein